MLLIVERPRRHSGARESKRPLRRQPTAYSDSQPKQRLNTDARGDIWSYIAHRNLQEC